MCTLNNRTKQVETKVSLALKRIGIVGDLINSFNFTEEETNKIFDALSKKVKSEKKRFEIAQKVKENRPFSF